jgi:ribosomal protein S18 acetylase RimI-like enzyme
VIAALPTPVSEADLAQLAALLVDAIDSGASTSFLPPLAPERALAWWRNAVAIDDPRGATLVVRDDDGIAGCVQLVPAWAPNQPHRGEIAKLLVHRRARRRGLGRALMLEAEARARAAGLTLLTLDTRRGDAADALYRALGWTPAGVIPNYAVDRHGVPHDTIYFYRTL